MAGSQTSLAGKVAWITGAGSGIGRAGAIELGSMGAHVALSGRETPKLEEVAARVAEAGGTASVHPLEVADAAAVERTAKAVEAERGRIDILVCSAGTNVPKRFWKEVSVADWDRVMRVNLDGPTYCARAVLPGMRARKDGLVIMISSWAGVHVTSLTGPAYTASKTGLIALTESINVEECTNGIRACAICPGEVATPILNTRPVKPTDAELAMMLQAEDLGRTIRFVAELPATACVNQIVISPTWNRFYTGAPPGRAT
jgi:NADP-dependent 3-hydroxy acid dehydrogenase YdfG